MPAGVASCAATARTLAAFRFIANSAAAAACCTRAVALLEVLPASVAASTGSCADVASRTSAATCASGTSLALASRVVWMVSAPRARPASSRSALPPAGMFGASGKACNDSAACTCAAASAAVLPLSLTMSATSVVTGLTNTTCAPVTPVATVRSVKAAPTAVPVSLSMAVAGTWATTPCRPAMASGTSSVYLPSASVLVLVMGSPGSQLPLSLRS